MGPNLKIITFLLALTGVIFFTENSTAEMDPFIDDVLYSKEGSDTKVLVQSGRDNATFYKYLILDDFSDAPENWASKNFNDSSWSNGAAPFGDRRYNNVDPNVDWDTSGSSPYNNDIILIRHKFQLNGIVTSAEIDVAFANYCTPYLNGNLIYDERGGNSHGAEYWNDDGTEGISSSSFEPGENVLAVYGRDYVYGSGNQNRQWLDLQITAQVFESTNESIIFGDSVIVAITGGNEGDESVDEYFINVTSNNKTIKTFYYDAIPAYGYGLSWLEWKPEIIGLNQLTVNVTCNCSDINNTNNLQVLNLTTVIYSLETTHDEELLIVNQSRLFNRLIQVKNTGNITDNVTLSIEDETLGNWNAQFTPNNFEIEAGETKDVLLTAVAPESLEDGYYNLTFRTQSQYNYVTTATLLQRGSYGGVDWKWINSTTHEELYDNINWTKLNFNDTDWKNGSTPFGDSDVDGIDYNTFWEGDNYAYFRHIIDIPDINLYEGGFMSVNVATNNYGDYYINGAYVFGDMDIGDGHGAEYWNDEFQIYLNYLNQGPNIIASVVSNPQNTQWFDEEILITFPQANLWNYKSEISSIPLYLDSTPPTTRVIGEGFYRNSSTFEVKWKSISNYDDLSGYYIYYLEKDGGNLGEWTLLGFYTNESTNFTGQGNLTYRFKSIAIDNNGNVENKGTYDTEMRVDLITPKSTLWIVEGNIEFTNLDGITIQWKANNTMDIQAYLIEYRDSKNQTWKDFGAFTSTGEYWFSPEEDETFEIRSRTIDYAGNKEIKLESDIIVTFDRLKPEVKLNSLNQLTGSDQLIISIENRSEGLDNIELEYARLLEDVEDVLEWREVESEWQNEEILMSPLIDGYTYYFRINPSDLAGNKCPREPYEYQVFISSNQTEKLTLPVMPLKPIMIGKIRNIEMSADENGDGIFEKTLEEYTGIDLRAMKANQYWVNYLTGEIIFGDGQDGYMPPNNSSLNLAFNGYDLVTTVDLKLPEPIEQIEYVIEDRNNVTITWKKPLDATSFIVESKKNFSMPWISVTTIDIKDNNEPSYKATNLSDGFHYYRVISVDRMGYTNPNMINEHIRVIIEAEVNSVIEAEPKQTEDLYLYGLVGVVLGSIAIYGASRLLKSETDVEVASRPMLIPVDNTSEEQTTITESEVLETFSVVPGSQFSRQLMYVCEKGCMKEFEVEGEDEEVMCPHCGTIGDLI